MQNDSRQNNHAQDDIVNGKREKVDIYCTRGAVFPTIHEELKIPDRLSLPSHSTPWWQKW